MPFFLFISTDSPVVGLSIEVVEFEYCFDATVVCSVKEILDVHDHLSGRLHIFVYPNLSDDVNQFDFVTVGGKRTDPSKLPRAFIIIGFIIIILLVISLIICEVCKIRRNNCRRDHCCY